jgi:Holliday junction resolvase RusA-like endonuclease
VNHANITLKNGRRVKSEEYRNWGAKATMMFKLHLTPVPKSSLPVKIVIVVEGKVNKGRDLSNMVKIVEDSLVNAGILPDDNVKYVSGSAIEYVPSEQEGTVRIEIHDGRTVWRRSGTEGGDP